LWAVHFCQFATKSGKVISGGGNQSKPSVLLGSGAENRAGKITWKVGREEGQVDLLGDVY